MGQTSDGQSCEGTAEVMEERQEGGLGVVSYLQHAPLDAAGPVHL